jgi:hypothetical protein
MDGKLAMRRLFLTWLFICAALFGAWQASAQMLMPIVNFGGPRATYQGPGNLFSFATFYSARAYSAAKAGNKAYRLINETTTLQTDINTLSNGLPDTVTPATFCIGATCKYVTFYDQTGNLACAGSTACDLTQATDADRIVWTANSLNGWPCGNSNGVTFLYATANALALSAPYTFMSVAERTSGTSVVSRIFYSATNGTRLAFSNAANTASLNGGSSSLLATATDAAFHALIGAVASSNAALIVDGTATTGTPGSSALAGLLYLMNDTSANLGLVGNFCEGGIVPANLYSSGYSSLNSNMHSATNGWNF